MDVLYIVLPLALLIAAVAVAGCVWMVNGGQLDDLDSPAHRILHDDAPAPARRDAAGDSPSDRADEGVGSASEERE